MAIKSVVNYILLSLSLLGTTLGKTPKPVAQ